MHLSWVNANLMNNEIRASVGLTCYVSTAVEFEVVL